MRLYKALPRIIESETKYLVELHEAQAVVAFDFGRVVEAAVEVEAGREVAVERQIQLVFGFEKHFFVVGKILDARAERDLLVEIDDEFGVEGRPEVEQRTLAFRDAVAVLCQHHRVGHPSVLHGEGRHVDGEIDLLVFVFFRGFVELIFDTEKPDVDIQRREQGRVVVGTVFLISAKEAGLDFEVRRVEEFVFEGFQTEIAVRAHQVFADAERAQAVVGVGVETQFPFEEIVELDFVFLIIEGVFLHADHVLIADATVVPVFRDVVLGKLQEAGPAGDPVFAFRDVTGRAVEIFLCVVGAYRKGVGRDVGADLFDGFRLARKMRPGEANGRHLVSQQLPERFFPKAVDKSLPRRKGREPAVAFGNDKRVANGRNVRHRKMEQGIVRKISVKNRR